MSPEAYNNMSQGDRGGSLATDRTIPGYVFSANTQDPGIHKISTETKQSRFIELESCRKPAQSFAISSHNQHGLLKCEGDKSDFFFVEVDLVNEKYIQTINHGGQVHTMDNGRFFVVLGNDELHLFEAKSRGEASVSVPFDEDGQLADFGGFAKLVFAEKEGANVAIISSSTMNQVLVVKMEDIADRKVVRFPGQGTVAGFRGRVITAGTRADGHMYALVSADLLYEPGVMHVVDMGDGTDIQGSEWLEGKDVSVNWGYPLMFVHKPAIPKVDNFWVFDDNRDVHIVNPERGEVQEILVEEVCDGDLSSPVQVGEHVLAACESQNHVVAINAISGKVAKVNTCNTPQRLATVPWRAEVYVQCRDTPESSNSIDGGIVHVISTQHLGRSFPLVNALRSPQQYNNMPQSDRGGNLASDESIPDFTFSTNAQDPGIHKINMDTKMSHFINLEPWCARPASGLAISAHNQHGLLKCGNDRFSFVEVDLMNEKYIQTINLGGEVHTMASGRYFIVLDDDILQIFEAKSTGQEAVPVPFDQDGLFKDFGGFAKLVFAQKEDAIVAVISSSTKNKVLIINMEDITDRQVVNFPGQGTIAGFRGRTISAGSRSDGHMYALVSADLLYKPGVMHVVDMGYGSNLANSVWLEENDITVDWSKPLMFVSKPAATMTPASYAPSLEDRLKDLEESMWGKDLSENFWVFSNDGMRVIDPVDGDEKLFMEASSLCKGSCDWGHPVTDGASYVVVAKRTENRVMVFDVHSGAVKADIGTCTSPYRVDLAPWRSEIYVHCWNRPEDGSVHSSDGLVDVINTNAWTVRNPLVDAIYSQGSPIHGDIFTSPAFPNHAWSTNFADHGIHKIDLETRQSNFTDLEGEGCTSALSLAISAKTHRGILSCNYGGLLLELDLDTNEVVANLSVTGTPYASADGTFFVVVPGSEDNSTLHIFEAQEQGPSDATKRDVTSEIQGLNQLAFIELDGLDDIHIAVVTSVQENKVLLVDMNNIGSTRVLELPGENASTAPTEGHPPRRYVEAGAMDDGRMVALVSAQLEEMVHVIDMGTGNPPPLDAAQVRHEVGGISGEHPKMLFVPSASRQAAAMEGTTVDRSVSVGLMEVVRGQVHQLKAASEQERQQLRSDMGEFEERQSTVEGAVVEIIQAVENATEILGGAAPAAAANSKTLKPMSSHSVDLAKLENLGEMLDNLLQNLRTNTQQRQNELQARPDLSQELEDLRSEVDGIEKGESDTAIAAVVIACVGFVGMLALAIVVVVILVRSRPSRPQSWDSSAVLKGKGSLERAGQEQCTLSCDGSSESHDSHKAERADVESSHVWADRVDDGPSKV